MKNCKSLKSLLWAPLIGALMLACNDGKKSVLSHAHATTEQIHEIDPPSLPSFGNLVVVRTTGMNFILPEEIPSGWTTFRYSNESPLAHFMLIDKLPVFEGKQKTYEDFKKIAPVFNAAMDLINEGKMEEGFKQFKNLPEWSPEIVYSGGVGIISPGQTAQTTVYLEPGTYAIECYIKTGGKFHPMSKALRVRESSSNETPPSGTLELELSREGGIEMKETPKAGIQTIAVHYKDQGPHEHFLGHDVHLVQLESQQQTDELNSWMNWVEPGGLNTPAPALFLGGAQEMPAGKTAYITVDLEPGTYAWIAEVPDPASKNMLKTFTVTGEKNLLTTKE